MNGRMTVRPPNNLAVIVEALVRGTVVHQPHCERAPVYDKKLIVTLAQARTHLRADACPKCFPGGLPW